MNVDGGFVQCVVCIYMYMVCVVCCMHVFMMWCVLMCVYMYACGTWYVCVNSVW